MRHQKGSARKSGQGLSAQIKTQDCLTENEYSMPGTNPGSTSLEIWIRRLGVEVEISMKHGRRSQAYSFLTIMHAAIRSRSQAQQHRRFMEIDAAICSH